MNQFVIIFRQGPGLLTDNDLRDRQAATRDWAQRVNAAGHKLDPHILAPESRWIGPNGAGLSAAVTAAELVTALLFLEARDLAEAAAIAKAHPAIRYGASVEVRPWAPPPTSPATP